MLKNSHACPRFRRLRLRISFAAFLQTFFQTPHLYPTTRETCLLSVKMFSHSDGNSGKCQPRRNYRQNVHSVLIVSNHLLTSISGPVKDGALGGLALVLYMHIRTVPGECVFLPA